MAKKKTVAKKITHKRGVTLYDIHEDFHALEALLIEMGGDISDPEIEEMVDALILEVNENLDAKVDGYCRYIMELEAQAEARKAEATRLNDLAKINKNIASRIKLRLKMGLDAMGKTNLKTTLFGVSICKNGGKRVLTVNDDAVPDGEYLEWVARPDRTAIRAALEDGKTLEFAKIEPQGTHLRIK